MSWCGDYIKELNVHYVLLFRLYVRTINISVAHPCMIPVDCVCFTNRMLIVLQGSWFREVVHRIITCFLYVAFETSH